VRADDSRKSSEARLSLGHFFPNGGGRSHEGNHDNTGPPRPGDFPVEVRRMLGLKPKDKVAFRIEDGRVSLGVPAVTLETAFGSVKPSRRPEDFKKLSRKAWDAKVEETLREMRQV